VVIVYLAYLLVTVPLLYQRLRRHPVHTRPDRAYFNLGRWGLPVNIVAVVFGIALLINVAWPRAEVYDPAGGHWYLQYFAVLFVAAFTLVGAIAYPLMERQREREGRPLG